MKKSLFGLALWCCALGFAADKDTLPLKKTTASGGTVSDRVESQLLAPKKNGGAGNSGGAAVNNGAGAPKGKMPQPSGPYIAALDTFGSSKINETALRQFLGKDLDVWLQKGLKADPTALEDENKLKERIRQKWNFALVEWSVIQYFEPGDMAIFITLDVVEQADAKRRMTFLPAPTADLADPGGLLNQWREYENKSMELIEKGQLQPQAVDCVALHCPFGHKHPNLKKYEKIFSEGVRKFEKDLADILAKDRRPENRGAAAYLLAYLKDGRRVVDYLSGRIRDPDEIVRNNSLRVLGDIAEFHREYVIPIKPVLEALTFPRVSDRSKAIYVAFHMASYSQTARDEILRSGVPDILRMLESRQPDHREFSHGILRRISGKDFPPTDIRAWNGWWEKTAADQSAIVKKPGN